MSVFLFAGKGYYPAGGWHDHVGKYATLDEAKEALRAHVEAGRADPRERPADWAHIVERGEIVATWDEAEVWENGHRVSYGPFTWDDPKDDPKERRAV